MEGFKLVFPSLVGSIFSFSFTIEKTGSNAKASPSLVGGMEEPPGLWLLSIRDNKPIRVCTPVSCICENEATVVDFPVHWVLSIEKRQFAISEEGLRREDKSQSARTPSMILN